MDFEGWLERNGEQLFILVFLFAMFYVVFKGAGLLLCVGILLTIEMLRTISLKVLIFDLKRLYALFF